MADIRHAACISTLSCFRLLGACPLEPLPKYLLSSGLRLQPPGRNQLMGKCANEKEETNKMTLSFSLAGVRVNISTSASSSDSQFTVSSLQQGDGFVEAEICNFSGKIVILEDDSQKNLEPHSGNSDELHNGASTSVGKIQECKLEQTETPNEISMQQSNELPTVGNPPKPEYPEETSFLHGENSSSAISRNDIIQDSSLPEVDAQHHDRNDQMPISNPKAGNSLMHQTNEKVHPSDSTKNFHTKKNTKNYTIDSHSISPVIKKGNSNDSNDFNSSENDEEEKESQVLENIESGRKKRVFFNLPDDSDNKHEISPENPGVDFSFHIACASEDADPYNLTAMLRANPELAAIKDEFGDYPAHIFSNNDSVLYTMESDHDAVEFVVELYKAFPEAFLTEGYSGQIPFATAICDWIDDCHQLYTRNYKGVMSLSEIKTLTRSTRIINALCGREEVQKLMSMPAKVELTSKVLYAFKMLSVLLDRITEATYEEVSFRREFYSTASKRRDKIIASIASLPFFVRTILLIDDEVERELLTRRCSIVRNAMFRKEAVGLWLVALLSGDSRSKSCAALYLTKISRLTISSLFGKRLSWSASDIDRFHHAQNELFDKVGSLVGFVPCLLHLGDRLNDVSLERGVRHAVEGKIRKPLPVYLMFIETILLLMLMTTYRMILELLYYSPSEDYLTDHGEFLGLSLSISIYFLIRDIATAVSLSAMEQNLWKRFLWDWGNVVELVTMSSVLVVLVIVYVKGSIVNKNYLAIVAGLLWLHFLIHTKGLSQHLSTLVYTIIEIARTLKYFVCVFCIAIFLFSDMIEVYKKTSGECNGVDEVELDSFCTMNPLQNYLAMYSIMIGGFDVTSLESSSAFVIIVVIAASFVGVIVLVNILIAIVTNEYTKASDISCKLFARARLELASRQVARERFSYPPEDPRPGKKLRRKIWIAFGHVKHLAYFTILETFLIEVLVACQSLEDRSIAGNFLYLSLILCAIIHHVLVVAVISFIVSGIIRDYERFSCLKGGKFHQILLDISLRPISYYLSSIGLGKSDFACNTDEDSSSHPEILLKNEYLAKQIEFERSVKTSITSSERRILDAIALLARTEN